MKYNGNKQELTVRLTWIGILRPSQKAQFPFAASYNHAENTIAQEALQINCVTAPVPGLQHRFKERSGKNPNVQLSAFQDLNRCSHIKSCLPEKVSYLQN